MKTIPPFRLILEPMSEEAKMLNPFKWAEYGAWQIYNSAAHGIPGLINLIKGGTE